MKKIDTVADALDHFGDDVAKLAGRGGALGFGAIAAAAILKASAGAMRSRGESADQILARIRPPRKLELKLDDDTETKNEKRKPSVLPPKE